MSEEIKSFWDEIKNRLGSSVYGKFILFWLVVHHNLMFALFFVSEEKIYEKTGLLKNEYLGSLFWGDSFWSVVVLWILPAVLTFIFIWFIPKYINIHLFRKEKENENAEKIVILEKAEEIEDIKKDLEKKKGQGLNLQKENIIKESTIKKLDPTIEWKREYEQFIKSNLYQKFNLIIESIYEHGGDIKVYGDFQQIDFQLSQDILAFAHTNDLITIDKKTNKIELTDKGKFFVKEYTNSIDRVRKLMN